MGKHIDITGRRYGRLTAVKRAENKGKLQQWIFKCSCGNEKIVRKHDVMDGKTQSCGCFHLETLRKISKMIRTTHGFKNHPLYNIWSGMKQRCNSVNSISYKHYGGRGIKICERWNSIANFIFDLEESYNKHCGKSGRKNTQLNRIDNDGDYSPQNCEWSTCIEQARNKRSNKHVHFNGKEITLKELSEKVNIGYETLYRRIVANKQPVNLAISAPVIFQRQRTFVYKNRKYTISDLTKITKWDYSQLHYRLTRAGWSVEDAIEQ